MNERSGRENGGNGQHAASNRSAVLRTARAYGPTHKYAATERRTARAKYTCTVERNAFLSNEWFTTPHGRAQKNTRLMRLIYGVLFQIVRFCELMLVPALVSNSNVRKVSTSFSISAFIG
jgi:hypothetical protein